jgi:hypothetical protein
MLKTIICLLWEKKFILFVIIITTLIIGEIWLRIPFIPQRLEYQPDKDLGAILQPNQSGYMWLGNMSIRSPEIIINSYGYRGKEIDRSKHIILALGGSDTFGSGVKENEVWTNIFEINLNKIQRFSDHVVVNAAHPGHGPSHNLIRLQRFIKKDIPVAIIIRINTAGRMFLAPNESQKEIEYIKAKKRYAIRKYTKFLPFIYNKVKLQLPIIKKVFRPKLLSSHPNSNIPNKENSGELTWRRNKLFWSKMISVAQNFNIPLVFCVSDLIGSEGNIFLKQKLEYMCSNLKNLYVIYIGPEAIGLENVDKKYAQQIFREKYTLRLDPHGNPLYQHIIASKTLEYFIKENIL